MMRLFKLSLLKDFERERSPADDCWIEGLEWFEALILNEEGRKYFENYLFDVKKNYCRARDNYVYVLETLDEIEMKLDYWRRNNELVTLVGRLGQDPDRNTRKMVRKLRLYR